MCSSQNALIHGGYSQGAKEEERRLKSLLRDCTDILRKVLRAGEFEDE